jgi:uncharacterized protein YigE (DUF2233 family)
VRTARQPECDGQPECHGQPECRDRRECRGQPECHPRPAHRGRHNSVVRRLAFAWTAALWLCSQAHAVECSPLVSAGHPLTVCRADVQQDALHLYLNDNNGRPFHTIAALEKSLAAQGKRLTFAMNAGMFQPDYSPVGLFIEQGNQLAPLNLQNGRGNFFLKPNGVFYVSDKGAAIVQSADFANVAGKVTLATQSGPMLVIDGQIHYRLSKTSTSRHIRNGVGVDDAGKVIFVVSDAPLTLYELAAAFRDDLHCPNALYLDGSVTSVAVPALNQRIQRADIGPILAIVEDAPRP